MIPSELMPAGDSHPYRVRSCRHGTMLYSINDRYLGEALHLYGECSQIELEALLQIVRPTDTIVEAGANIGVLTVPLARAVPRGVVYAFEPQRLTFQILNANIALNGLTNVHARHAAAGGARGLINVPVLDPMVLQNFGGLSLLAGESGEPVPVQTIDSLNLATCRLIKADVQGMELDVLKGAEATIKRCRPILYVENEQPGMGGELTEWIQEARYKTWAHLPKLYNPENHLSVEENIYPNVASANMLCIPTEMNVTVGLREIPSKP